jgi:hypothetical protein
MREMMDYATGKSALIDEVIDQIKLDIANGDVTALEEMLVFLDNKTLQNYLPEVDNG